MCKSSGFFIFVLLACICTYSFATLPDDRYLQTQGTYNQTVADYSSTDRRKSSEASGSNEQNQLQQTGRLPQDGDLRVPYWNIAHMINSIGQIEKVLRAGANGIEVDISFDSNGVPVEAYHGFPCDCGRHCHYREDLDKFIKKLAELTIPPADSGLIFVQFDLKLSKLNEQMKRLAGTTLATMLHQNIYDKYLLAREQSGDDLAFRPPLRFLISVNHAPDKVLIDTFLKYMEDNHLDFMYKNVGFEVGMNDNLTEISNMWNEFDGRVTNIWQGDGLTNCANIIRGIERLKDAITMRNHQGHFRKVYYWTTDIMFHIRSVLRLGLDASLTNTPERVVKALNEPEFVNRYRLATAYDDPFAQYWIQATAWKMSRPTLVETIETVKNVQESTVKYLKSLPGGLRAAAIKAGRDTRSLG